MLEQLTDGASSLLTSVTDSAKSMTDKVVQQVTDLIEGVIVMIVTSCVIPLLVLAAFFCGWGTCYWGLIFPARRTI